MPATIMCPVIQTPSVAKSWSKQVREENMPNMIVNNHGASQVGDRHVRSSAAEEKTEGIENQEYF